MKASRKEEELSSSLKSSASSRKTAPTNPQIVVPDDESLDISLPPHPVYSDDDIDVGSFDAAENSPSIGTLSRSRHIPGSDDDDDISLTEALASVSRTPSPIPSEQQFGSNIEHSLATNLTESALAASAVKVSLCLQILDGSLMCC